MAAIKTFEVKASDILYLHCVAVSTIRVTQMVLCIVAV